MRHGWWLTRRMLVARIGLVVVAWPGWLIVGHWHRRPTWPWKAGRRLSGRVSRLAQSVRVEELIKVDQSVAVKVTSLETPLQLTQIQSAWRYAGQLARIVAHNRSELLETQFAVEAAVLAEQLAQAFYFPGA